MDCNLIDQFRADVLNLDELLELTDHVEDCQPCFDKLCKLEDKREVLFNNAKHRIANGVSHEELDEIDRLRRIVLEVAEPEPMTFTTATGPPPFKPVLLPRLPLDEIEAKITETIAATEVEVQKIETARKLLEDRLRDLHADLDLLHLARPMLERWLPAVPMRYGPGLRNALPEMFRTSHEWLTAQELTARLIETGYQFQRAETDSSKRASIYQTCRALVRSGILRTEISDGQAKFQLT